MATVLACFALLATFACLGALVWVHLLPTGYRPIRNAVSDYGIGRYRTPDLDTGRSTAWCENVRARLVKSSSRRRGHRDAVGLG